MKKGLITTLTAAVVSLGIQGAFAYAPVIGGLPDVVVGDAEDNIGTDNNFFVFTNAFKFDDFVGDQDTTVSTLLWSFDEGDDQTTPTVVTGTQWYKVNEKNPIHVGATAQAVDGSVGASHLSPAAANELRQGAGSTSVTIAAGPYASFRDIIFTPTAGTAGFTPGGGTPAANTPTAKIQHQTGKIVRFFASDGSNVASKDIIVKTIDNTSDTVTGGVSFSVLVDDTLDSPATRWGNAATFPGDPQGNVGTVTSGASRSTVSGAIVASVTANPAGDQFRVSQWLTNAGQSILYSAVGTTKVVRGKYFIYGQNDSGDTDTNHIPDFRLRVANRFAINSMLEVLHGGWAAGTGGQDAGVTSGATGAQLAADVRPSTNPASPSLYRVDFDPIDVPFLTSNAGTESILFGFEAYTLASAVTGSVGLTELQMGTYDASALVENGTTLLQTYLPADLEPSAARTATFDVALTKATIVRSSVTGNQLPPTTNNDSRVSITGSPSTGITIDTSAVPSDTIGIGAVDYSGTVASSANQALRPRVESGKQYKFKFHLTSTQNVNNMSQIRMRARSVKFYWSQKLEVGGANIGGNGQTIARQALPGVGTLNTSGNYNLLMYSPLSPAIKASQSVLGAQPGPGVASASRRDLLPGFDVLDTLAGADTEQTNVTIDRIDIYKYDAVADGSAQ